jgi:hypothetical protein
VTIGAVSPRNDVRVAPYTNYPVLISSEPSAARLARSMPAGVDKIVQVVDDVTESISRRNHVGSDAAMRSQNRRPICSVRRVEEIGG